MRMRDQFDLRFLEDVTPPRVTFPPASLSAERVELVPTRFEYATTGNVCYFALHDIIMDDGEIRVGAAFMRSTQPLTQGQIVQVRASIAGRLADRISLSDLSAVTGLSKFHVAWAFKTTTGLSALPRGRPDAPCRRKPPFE
jgi:hypothetical protein